VKIEQMFEHVMAELQRQYAGGKALRDCPTNDDLWEYWEGKLSEGERRKIEEHVFECPVCFVEFERIRDIVEDIEKEEIRSLGSILGRISELREKLSTILKPVYVAKSDDLIPAAIMDDREDITDFAIFRVLVHPEVEEGMVSMAFREYEDSDRFDGYLAHVILTIDGKELELLSRVRGAEIVLEDERLPSGDTKEGNISNIELYLRRMSGGR